MYLGETRTKSLLIQQPLLRLLLLMGLSLLDCRYDLMRLLIYLFLLLGLMERAVTNNLLDICKSEVRKAYATS